jgi:hypothetical protein
VSGSSTRRGSSSSDLWNEIQPEREKVSAKDVRKDWVDRRLL